LERIIDVQKLLKNSQLFGKKCQKTSGGNFFDSHCRLLNNSAYNWFAVGRGAVFRADAVQLPVDTMAARSRLFCYLWCSSTQSLPV